MMSKKGTESRIRVEEWNGVGWRLESGWKNGMEVGVRVEEWNGGWSEGGRMEWRME